MGPTWPYVDVELRRAIDEGAVPGPRLMVAGSYISSTGGAGDARQFSDYVDVPLVKNLADGPSEITKAVRTNLKNGADFIKILATGAVPGRVYPCTRCRYLCQQCWSFKEVQFRQRSYRRFWHCKSRVCLARGCNATGRGSPRGTEAASW